MMGRVGQVGQVGRVGRVGRVGEGQQADDSKAGGGWERDRRENAAETATCQPTQGD